MTISILLNSGCDNLVLLETVGDALAHKLDKIDTLLNNTEKTVWSLWVFIAANPAWQPPPLNENQVVSALETIGRPDLVQQISKKFSPPDYELAVNIRGVRLTE